MNLKKTIFFLTITAFAVAAVIGIAAYHTASAQETTPTVPPDERQAFVIQGHHGFIGETSLEELANALGISVEELQAAIEEAKDAALAQAVEEGLITQAQADELAEGRKVFPFGGRWVGWLSQEGIDYQAHLAEALGITTEELEAAYQQAAFARIDRAVENGLLSEEQADLMKGRYALFNNENFQSSMQSAFESAVNQAVAEGVITQAQADQILEQRENRWSGGRGGFFGGVFGGLKEFGGFGVFGPRGEGEWRFFEFKDRISPELTETAPSDGA